MDGAFVEICCVCIYHLLKFLSKPSCGNAPGTKGKYGNLALPFALKPHYFANTFKWKN